MPMDKIEFNPPILGFEYDGETISVWCEDPETLQTRDIAWSAPGSNLKEFIWLVQSAAALHDIDLDDSDIEGLNL